MPIIKILPHAEYCPNGTEIEARRHFDLRSHAGQRHQYRACLRYELRLHDLPCHRQGGLQLLNEAEEEEEDLLDKAWGLQPQSRLSCQAILARENVTVEIPKYSINHAKENHCTPEALPPLSRFALGGDDTLRGGASSVSWLWCALVLEIVGRCERRR
jgi:2Fe-2S ferredoxin